MFNVYVHSARTQSELARTDRVGQQHDMSHMRETRWGGIGRKGRPRVKVGATSDIEAFTDGLVKNKRQLFSLGA